MSVLHEETDENAMLVDEDRTVNGVELEHFVKMSKKRISLAINVSILIILAIFGVLLSLPLRMLLNTNYHSRNETIGENYAPETTENVTTIETVVIPIDYRKLKRCPKLDYEEYFRLIFGSYYDRNCTYSRIDVIEDSKEDEIEDTKEEVIDDKKEISIVTKETVEENLTENTEESGKDRRMKSVPVAEHILMTMLLISAITALIEVLRIRFARDKDSSKAVNASSRKASTVELSVRNRFLPRQPMNSQRSFEMQGARPPPLIRRSSFPTQPSKQNSVTGTPNNRTSRRQSAESDEEIGVLIKALHHRTRLIRRH
ncbi:uncharacterized protein LOC143147180 isoform X2 [Ptiloglossa arizonensis]|uniref:uncharacterized protein LOC143147180 isoform X2 n=1 Tax=Ptiloglossa arizonensis TaxID=3350558 RepID=UPI003FA03791